jgi:hypothetical protein
MDIIGVLGLVVSIIGILAGIVTAYYAWNLTAKRLSSQKRNSVLLDPQKQALLNKLEIFFSGTRINNLSQADCTVWNSGRAVIYGSDVKSPNGITISFPAGTEILEITSNVSSPLNKLSLQKNSATTLSCQFEYLRRGEGFSATILYAGPSTVPEITATIPESPYGGITGPERSKKLNTYSGIFATSLGVLFVGSLILSHYFDLNQLIFVVITFPIIYLLALGGQRVFRELEISPPSFSSS